MLRGKIVTEMDHLKLKSPMCLTILQVFSWPCSRQRMQQGIYSPVKFPSQLNTMLQPSFGLSTNYFPTKLPTNSLRMSSRPANQFITSTRRIYTASLCYSGRVSFTPSKRLEPCLHSASTGLSTRRSRFRVAQVVAVQRLTCLCPAMRTSCPMDPTLGNLGSVWYLILTVSTSGLSQTQLFSISSCRQIHLLVATFRSTLRRMVSSNMVTSGWSSISGWSIWGDQMQQQNRNPKEGHWRRVGARDKLPDS